MVFKEIKMLPLMLHSSMQRTIYDCLIFEFTATNKPNPQVQFSPRIGFFLESHFRSLPGGLQRQCYFK